MGKVIAACTVCSLRAARAKEVRLGFLAYTPHRSVEMADDAPDFRSFEKFVGMPPYEGPLLDLSDVGGLATSLSDTSCVMKPETNGRILVWLCGSGSFNICALDQSEVKPASASQLRRQMSTRNLSDNHLDRRATPIESMMPLRWTRRPLSGCFNLMHITLRAMRIVVKACRVRSPPPNR